MDFFILSHYLLASTAKLTTGYIKQVQELIDACDEEGGNLHLIGLSTALRKRLHAEREVTLKYEEVKELCLLKSVADAGEDDPKFPKFATSSEEIDAFQQFHEQYVADIEYAREVEATPELIEQCETQIVILEELFLEKKSILEESNLKKKKGKKGKK